MGRLTQLPQNIILRISVMVKREAHNLETVIACPGSTPGSATMLMITIKFGFGIKQYMLSLIWVWIVTYDYFYTTQLHAFLFMSNLQLNSCLAL